MKHTKITISLCWIGVILLNPMWAQFDKDYSPLQSSGEIPKYVIQRASVRTSEDLKNSKLDMTKEQQKEFFALSNYVQRQSFLTGNILFNDEVSSYLNAIKDILLRDMPEVRDSIRVFASRYVTPNASCWRDGTVFFNLSLLEYLDSEAQLAFIISHEASHYIRQHSYQKFKRKTKVRELALQKGTEVDDLFEQLRFSREKEIEADSLGLLIYLNSKYDPDEAVKALEALYQIDSRATKLPTLDILELFHVKGLEVDSIHDCLTGLEAGQIAMSSNLTISFKESERDAPREQPQAQDSSLGTHPSIEERVGRIRRQIDEGTLYASGQKFLVGERRFFEIQEVAKFECIQKHYEQGKYTVSLFEALSLALTYPENAYLQSMVLKSMYWIQFMDKTGSFYQVVPLPYYYLGEPYGIFLCYLRSKSEEDIRGLSLLLARDRLGKPWFKEKEDILLWAGRIFEINEENQDAQACYRNLLSLYPDSKHKHFAAHKISTLK
ncbi:MAG: M48 family metallopeptidase [Bacteroidota bacterium]